jgi:predicted nucleic acid-binding protein
MIVLVDTNIWVSSFINPFGFPGRMRQLRFFLS